MKNIWAKIGGAAAAVALCIILIQGGAAQNLEHYQCGMEEHAHGASCYGFISTCGQDESEAHSHGPSCYDTEEERVCNTADDEEHEHTDSCWKTREVLTCALSEEKRHTHSSDCEREGLICDYSEHTHSDSCVASEGTIEYEEPEDSEDTDMTMEEFLDIFTTGCYAFGSAFDEPGTRFAARRLGGTNETWNLGNYVTGVIIKDKNDIPVMNGNFYHSFDYIFNITFAERTSGGGQFSYNLDGKLVYQLPEQIIVKKPVTKGVINGANGVKIGDYTIEASGRVEVWFGNFDREGNAVPQNFIDYYSDTIIRLDIVAQFGQGTGQISVDFGADAVIAVDLSLPPSGISVKKTAPHFNRGAETIDYTIEVTPVDGKLTGIELTDELLCVIPTESDFRIKNSDVAAGNYSSPFVDVKYSTNNGSSWTNTAFTASGDNWCISFSGVDLDPNGTVKSLKVQYTLDLVSLVDHFADREWIERMRYDLRLNSTVTATGKDMENTDQAVTDTAMTQTQMLQFFLEKTGSVTGGVLQWTATVGNGYKRLNGLTIANIPRGDQSIVGDVIVKIWGKDRNDNIYGTLVSPDVIMTLPITDLAVESNNFTFDVPSGGWPGAENVYDIQFIYNATRGGGFPTGHYESLLAVSGNGIVARKNGLVIIRPDETANIIKESSLIYNSSGRLTGIEYTIRMEIGPGNQDKYLRIVDKLGLSNRKGANPATLNNERIYNRPQDLKVTIEPHDPNFKYFVSPADLTANTTNEFSIFPNSTTASESLWPYSDQRTVTVRYRIDLDSPGNIIGNTTGKSPIERLEEEEKTLFNELRVTNSWSPYMTFGPLNGMAGAVDILRIIEKSATANKDDPAVFDFAVELNKNRPDYGSHYVGHKGYPLFEKGRPAIFEDAFDGKLEYVPGSLVVVRHPADGSTTAAQYSYYGPYDPVTKKDLVNISGNTISADFRNMCNIETWKGSAESSTGFAMPTVTVIPTSNNTTHHKYKYWYAYYEKATPSSYYPQAYKYTVKYQLRVKDQYAVSQGGGPEKLIMKSTARVYPTAPKYAGGKWESSATVEYTPARATTKNMTVDGSIASVEITINPAGVRMRPLNVLPPRFTAIDVMSNDLAIYQGSVRIYTKGADDKWKTTPETPQPDGLWGVNFISGQEGHFELMDEKAVKITYDALILKPVGAKTSFDNKVTVYGQTTVAGKDNFTVQKSNAVTSGNKSGLLLYKRDRDTGVRLPGAAFEVYLAMKGNNTYDSAQTEYINVRGTNFFYVETVDDASNTSIGIYRFTHTGIRRSQFPEENGVYLIRETRTPDANYTLPPEYTYFVLDPNDKAYWEGKLGGAVHVISDNIHLTNESNLSDVVIAGEKRLTGQVSATSATFGFELTQVNPDGSPYRGGDAVLTGPLYTFLTVAPDAQAGAFAFDNIHGLTESEYYFMVEEVDAPVGWTPMTAPQIIRVTVFGDDVAVEYPESTESADKVVFTNKYRDLSAPYADALIHVNKTIDAEDFDTSKVFTFNIEEMVKDTLNGGFKPGTLYGYNISDSEVAITGDGRDVFALEDLPAPKFETAGTVRTYYFRVSEADESATDSDWQYDTTEYIVRAEVTYDKDRGGLAKLTYLEGESWADFETLTFTNTYAQGGPKLPDTGGTGMLPFILVGMALAALLILHRQTLKAH